MTTARQIMTTGAECVRDYESVLVAAEKPVSGGAADGVYGDVVEVEHVGLSA
jgi:hypothetical protein